MGAGIVSESELGHDGDSAASVTPTVLPVASRSTELDDHMLCENGSEGDTCLTSGNSRTSWERYTKKISGANHSYGVRYRGCARCAIMLSPDTQTLGSISSNLPENRSKPWSRRYNPAANGHAVN